MIDHFQNCYDWLLSHASSYTGLSLLTLYKADNSFEWELLRISSKTRPKVTYFQHTLLYKPGLLGPFLFSPLNWFFSWMWFKFVFIKWMISHRLGPNSTYSFYSPFPGPLYVFVPFPARVSKRKCDEPNASLFSSSSKRRQLQLQPTIPLQSKFDGFPGVVPTQPPEAP